MKAAKTIYFVLAVVLFLLAATLICFSFLYILASFSAEGSISWLWFGIMGMIVGFLCIYWGLRFVEKAKKTIQNVTSHIDLPGKVSMVTIKCQTCGAPLGPEVIKIVNGTPMVSCPYCGTTYQLTEEPKW